MLKQQMFNDCSSIYFFPAPILDLAQNDFVQSKVEEAAKLFYNNANVTINLVPALVGGGLLLILLVPLLALLFQPAEAGASGYGAPAAEYGAPAPAYGAPEYRSVGVTQIALITLCVSFNIILWTFSRVVFPDLEGGGIIDNGCPSGPGVIMRNIYLG